ncbi:hypothetical protein ABPG77_005778 [Micractinium sp. CCAP 211/92]
MTPIINSSVAVGVDVPGSYREPGPRLRLGAVTLQLGWPCSSPNPQSARKIGCDSRNKLLRTSSAPGASRTPMACLEVHDIPSAASTDDLGVLVAQFAPVLRVLLLSHGPSTLDSALVWVGSGDVAAVADALDSHPLAGGLVSVRLCEDPMRWVVASVGADQLIGTSNNAQQHAAPAATPAQHSQPATPVPQPLGHPAPSGSSGGDARECPQALSSSGGGGKVSEVEAELRLLQEQLQAQALEGAFDEWQAEPGDGWAQQGGDNVGSEDDEQREGDWQAAGRVGAAAQRERGVRGGGGGGSMETQTMLAVHNVDPSRDPRQLFHFFKRLGTWSRCTSSLRASMCLCATSSPARRKRLSVQ